MGNRKQKWTSEEEEALRAGVAKHGAGKWKHIQSDPEFNPFLYARSNIDLKDKWRNLNVASGQQTRDKSKAPKEKGTPSDAPITPVPNAHTSASVTPSSQDAPAEVVIGDSSRPVPEGSKGNNAFNYKEMIFEAISTLEQPNGSDCASIAAFIQKREQHVPPNFRKSLSCRLRKLVQQNILEKAENCYRIKQIGPDVKQKGPEPKPKDRIAEAAAYAAQKIAEDENKMFLAAEALMEAERIAEMAEEMQVILQFAKECVEKAERGEPFILK